MLTLPCNKTLPDVEQATDIARPLGLLPDDCHLLEKDDMQGRHVLAYIIRNNRPIHMGLRELQHTVVINCADFGLSGSG